MGNEKVTIEFYRDPLLVDLIGAIDVSAKRKIEAAQALGKVICRVNGINCAEAVLIDAAGEKLDQIVVFR